jgi:hypothetical protein
MSATKDGEKSRKRETKRITDILGTLRKNGSLPWNMVIDLTRELDLPLAYTSTREARAHTRAIYNEDRWLQQPYYPIFVVEKDTMEPVCKPMADKWHMPFASSRGYSSLKLQHDVAKVVSNRYARTGQQSIIYFVSDFDPSGLDLQRAWGATLKGFKSDCEVVRIALTRKQIKGRLKNLSIEVKVSDSRSKNYIKEHGERVWEADILPAAVIQKQLNAAVYSWLDVDAWSRRDAEIERATSCCRSLRNNSSEPNPILSLRLALTLL